MVTNFKQLPAIVIAPDELRKVVPDEMQAFENHLQKEGIRHIHLWWYLRGEGGEGFLEIANRLLNEMLNAFSEKTGIVLSYRHIGEDEISDDHLYVLEFDDMNEMIQKAYPLQEQGITFALKMLPVYY